GKCCTPRWRMPDGCTGCGWGAETGGNRGRTIVYRVAGPSLKGAARVGGDADEWGERQGWGEPGLREGLSARASRGAGGGTDDRGVCAAAAGPARAAARARAGRAGDR